MTKNTEAVKTIQLKLNITNRKKELLDRLMKDTQKCFNYLITVIKKEHSKGNTIYSPFALGKLCVYEDAAYPLKEIIGICKNMFLESMVVKAFSAYKANTQRKTNITFKPCATFRTRIVKVCKSKRGNYMLKISHPYKSRGFVILPITGRRYDEELEYIMTKRKNEFPCEIVKHGDEYFAHLGVKKELLEVKIKENFTAVGIDCGITNLAVAVATTGKKNYKPKFWSGRELGHKHEIIVRKLRLLGKGKKLATVRKMKHSMRERTHNILHKVSRELINYAKQFSNPVIFLEDLKGIRDECTIRRKNGKTPKKSKFGKKFNRMIGRWGYRRLQQMVEYKAKEEGIPLVYVSPKGTSSICPKCCEKLIRDYNIHISVCTGCGYKLNDDLVGAYNIALRGVGKAIE